MKYRLFIATIVAMFVTSTWLLLAFLYYKQFTDVKVITKTKVIKRERVTEIYENIEEHIVYHDPTLNGADPELTDQMIPVIYDGVYWVKANMQNKWYDYEKLMWANVVIPKPEFLKKYQNAEPGVVIPEENIYAYFVWVPRYEYELFNVDNKPVKEQMIRVKFVNKDTEKKTSLINGAYYTHPAFTANYSDKSYELNGFWIAKFEPSLNNSDVVEIKPGKKTLVNLNYADMWNYVVKMRADYNLDYEPRIITNMEWGAIAYLSYSQYSKLNNDDYNAKNKRIFSNTARGNYTTYDKMTTGCSGAKFYGMGDSTCLYSYDIPYYGQGASSTGTIYGIYDLSGGAWECTWSIVGTYPLKKNIGGYKGELPDNTRYYTLYKPSNNMYDYSRGQIGDATVETRSKTIENSSWQGNLAYLATTQFPWIKRGGTPKGGGYSGIFDYGITDAKARNDKTFRVIISSK
ncbi:MAG: hypothetical protein J5634_00520 [Bacilli bacterium]|nr:hypothetical protein [Bacilli bacterium]